MVEIPAQLLVPRMLMEFVVRGIVKCRIVCLALCSQAVEKPRYNNILSCLTEALLRPSLPLHSPPRMVITKLLYSIRRGIMQRLQNIRIGTLLAVIGMVAIPNHAHAYLDPGTGSVVLQVVVAGFLGALFTFKSYVRAGISAVARLFGKKDNASDA
jgi:hypothetical protein